MESWGLAVVWVGLPAVMYTLLLYAFDRHDREPLWALALALGLGAAAALAVGTLELWVDAHWPYLNALGSGERRAALRGAFLVVSPLEEGAKLLATLPLLRTRAFNEPVDGIVYAGTVALGFAGLEGALAAEYAGSSTLAVRAALAMPGHLCFSALWGAGLGALSFWGRRAVPYALGSLGAAWLAHGLYDYLLLADAGKDRAAVVPLVALTAMVTAISFRALLTASPFRPIARQVPACTRCHREARGTRFCAGCGAPLWMTEAVQGSPVALFPTLLGFVTGCAVAIGGLHVLARLHAAPPVQLVAWAGEGRLHPLLALVVVATAAGLGAGMATRRMRGARPTVEAVIAVGLGCLCLALWTALSGGPLDGVLYLSPLAVLAAAWSAGRAPTAPGSGTR